MEHEELKFLDSFVLDELENPPKDDSTDDGEGADNEEVSKVSAEEALLAFIEGMSPGAALAVIRAFKSLPQDVKDAENDVYATLRTLGGKSKMDDVKSALVALKKECGDGYGCIYDEVLKDVRRLVSKIQSRRLDGVLEKLG